MRFFLTVTVCFTFTGPALPADPRGKALDTSTAIKNGLAYLDEYGANWMESRKCAGCHHLPQTVWVFTEAKAAGYKVDEKFLGEVISFIAALDNRAKLVAEHRKPEELRLGIGAVYAMLALTALEKPTAEVRAWQTKYLKHILERQEKDGSWAALQPPNKGTPPVFDADATTSVLTAIAISRMPTDAKEAAVAKEATTKALKWLDEQKGDDAETQFHVLKLWLQVRGGDAAKVKVSVERVLTLQDKDGGWSQKKDTESDAWATGQALYVLSIAGCKPDDVAVQKARDFLLRTQLGDGSWLMKSRPVGNPPKLTKNLEPITYASTSWALLGLIRSSSKMPERK
jgi:hypothetical protein